MLRTKQSFRKARKISSAKKYLVVDVINGRRRAADMSWDISGASDKTIGRSASIFYLTRPSEACSEACKLDKAKRPSHIAESLSYSTVSLQRPNVSFQNSVLPTSCRIIQRGRSSSGIYMHRVSQVSVYRKGSRACGRTSEMDVPLGGSIDIKY